MKQKIIDAAENLTDTPNVNYACNLVSLKKTVTDKVTILYSCFELN